MYILKVVFIQGYFIEVMSTEKRLHFAYQPVHIGSLKKGVFHVLGVVIDYVSPKRTSGSGDNYIVLFNGMSLIYMLGRLSIQVLYS